jgi:hypothetical protein
MKKNNYTQTLTLTLNKIFNNKIFSNKIFTNKITLIIVAAIAFLSLYRYIMLYEFSAVLLFFIVGAIAYSFTKNMIVVLGTSFLATLIVELFKGLFGFKEGLESKTEETDDVLETDSVLETAKRLTKSAMAPKDEEPNEEASNTKASNTKASNTKASSKESNENESSKKTKDSYQNQIALNPGLYNMPNKEQMTKQLGKASETEQAYDNLEKIMGSKQINSLSSDTKDLIKQQNDLIKQLKSMTPALNDAMSTLGTLDLSKLTNIFNKQPANTEDAN